MYYLFAESNLANFWETWFHLFSRINGSPRFRVDCVAQRRRKIFKCVLPTWNEINDESSWFDVTVKTFWSPYLLMSKNVVKILVVGYLRLYRSTLLLIYLFKIFKLTDLICELCETLLSFRWTRWSLPWRSGRSERSAPSPKPFRENSSPQWCREEPTWNVMEETLSN
jgi:hypothetical protein